MILDPSQLWNTMVGDSGVSVATLLDLYVRTLDGKQNHEMWEHFGEIGEKVGETRDALTPVWKAMA